MIFQWYTPDNEDGTSKPVVDGYVLLGEGSQTSEEAGDVASCGTLAKVTIGVLEARELCAMFSSARRGLDKAADAEGTGSASHIIFDAKIKACGDLARALRRAERLLRPDSDKIPESDSTEEAAERAMLISQDEEDAAESAMSRYRESLNSAEAAEDGNDGGLRVPCESSVIQFLEKCFDIDSGSHSDAHPRACDWLRECILD